MATAMSEETKLFKDIEWLRNRRRELQTCVFYEKRKNGIEDEMDEEEEEEEEKIPDDFNVVQPELCELINKAAVYETSVKRLQMSDTLARVASGPAEAGTSAEEPMITTEVQELFGEIMEELTEAGSRIAEEHEDIDTLSRENVSKQLELSRMVQERYTLMDRYRKKEEREEKMKEAMRNEKVKFLETKVRTLSKIIEINNVIMQLIIAFSGVKWCKDHELTSIIVGCGKPFEEQLQKHGSQS